MKYLKILFSMLLILLSFTFFACEKEVIAKLTINYKEEMTVGEEIVIEVISSVEDDRISFENLNPNILELDGNKVKALKKGIGEIVINSLYKTSETISIFIVDAQAPSEINMSIQGENFVTEVEYQLVIDAIPNNASKEFNFVYNTSAIDLDEDTLKLIFLKPGKFTISCYSKKDRTVYDIIEINVEFNPEIEVYEILFVGNSLTKSNLYDIPQMVIAMMQEKGLRVNYTLDGPEAQWIIDHKATFDKLIENNKYTHVILQERSHGTVSDYNKFESAALEFSEKIKENGAKLILYQTWAYNIGWYDMTKYEMYEAIKEAYFNVANMTDATISPVGDAFVMFESAYGDFPSLYYDTHHPSAYGSFLSACVHYVTLTGRRASDVQYVYEEISEEYANAIKSIADQIVLGE